jgi:hypothetical protein
MALLLTAVSASKARCVASSSADEAAIMAAYALRRLQAPASRNAAAAQRATPVATAHRRWEERGGG